MNDGLEVISKIVPFFAVALLFILILSIVFKVTLKNYNIHSNKVKFYGLFLGMNNRDILAFSMLTLNYIFLIWCVATFSKLNIYYVFITLFLMILPDIILKDYKRIIKDLGFVMINILCIFVTSMLYDYLNTTYTSVFLLIILGFVAIFVCCFETRKFKE